MIIAANGKAFCAGHDLKEMRSSEDREFHQALFDQCGKLMLSIHQLPQPVIAQVNGIATAAGCQLVANCDLAVSTDEARFAVSGINVGLFCSTPAVPLSRNLPRKQAMQMLLTGEFISAQRAQQYGLVNEVVPAAELESATFEMAKRLPLSPGLQSRSAKRCSTSNCPWTLVRLMGTPASAWRAIWIHTMPGKASMRLSRSANPSGKGDKPRQ